jgi:type IV pilus assembly protein PilV
MRQCVKQGGATLLEVLIAVVVFSLGLLGLLSAAALSIRTNQDAYTGTQAVFVADYLTGAMRRNILGVVSGSYNVDVTGIDIYSSGAGSLARGCVAGAPCSPAKMAEDDIKQATVLLGQHFPPGAKAKILCTGNTVLATIAGLTSASTRPPYAGRCDVTITWAVDRSGTLKSRIWTIQP